jgi:hypothetical protein
VLYYIVDVYCCVASLTSLRSTTSNCCLIDKFVTTNVTSSAHNESETDTESFLSLSTISSLPILLHRLRRLLFHLVMTLGLLNCSSRLTSSLLLLHGTFFFHTKSCYAALPVSRQQCHPSNTLSPYDINPQNISIFSGILYTPLDV